MNPKLTIQEKLKDLRVERHLTLEQLAEETGISVRMIQKYEQGAKDLNGAKLHTLLKLCLALKCRLSDIVTEPEVIELLRIYEEND